MKKKLLHWLGLARAALTVAILLCKFVLIVMRIVSEATNYHDPYVLA
jgi:hypothetical protein